MKITAQQYAESLYEAVHGKTQKECADLLSNFVEILAANKDLSKADRILSVFVQTWNGRNKIVDAEVTFSREPGKETLDIVKAYISTAAGAEHVVVKEKIDAGILGGMIARFDGKVLDGSLRNGLDMLRDNLIK